MVEVSGMQKFEGSLTVLTGQSAVVDVAMKVGQTATEVQVHDVTPMLTVDSPTLSSTLERTRIEQLPINGRNLTNLLVTVPGMDESTRLARGTPFPGALPRGRKTSQVSAGGSHLPGQPQGQFGEEE